MAAVLQRAFREDGYAVDVQASGNDAVWMASECDFDAVILDVGLPDIDGFDVCRQLRGRSRWMPILMLTAREAVPDVVRGLDSGADDYMTKPVRHRGAPGSRPCPGPSWAGRAAGRARCRRSPA
jgi:two-component system OmpR family response regulator